MHRSPRQKVLGLFIGGSVILLSGWITHYLRLSHDSQQGDSTTNTTVAAQLRKLDNTEERAKQMYWGKELLAQKCGGFFETIWDSLLTATNKLNILVQSNFGEIILPTFTDSFSKVLEIQTYDPTRHGRNLAPIAWSEFINTQQANGWNLSQIEFRHIQFETNLVGLPDLSTFYFSAHLTNHLRPDRAIFEGNLGVQWDAQAFQKGRTEIRQLDASKLRLKIRTAPPPFQLIHAQTISPPRNAFSIDPLLVYDLDGDGYSEIILAGKNLIFRRTKEGGYREEKLCNHPPGLISSAILGDFDGDGFVDLLCLKHEGLVLFKGAIHGAFPTPELLVWPNPPDMTYPMVMTSGDIDQDNDLDLFIAQYKKPYEGGSMPTPFYDANDGYPSYLFLNNGHGDFKDATVSAGLAPKRLRRSYSSSFVDLNEDGFLDLVVVSDFSGVDVYQNDGRGHFTDRTQQWIDEPHAFGMAHALSDFNSDGRLDLLMIGMTSPTVDRLVKSGSNRPISPEASRMRAASMSGNRLYLAQQKGGFSQSPLGTSIARSGWAWGCTAFDVDNDGFPEVYVVNGMESKKTVRDYEAEYWWHDVFIGNSEDNPVAYLYFRNKFSRTRDQGQSYGGFEKNRLYLNQQGKQFFEAAHLFDVALEQDSRNVVSEDLDGDGRMDLVVVSYAPWPSLDHTLRIFQNRLETPGNWIGFRFKESQGKSLIGTQVHCSAGNRVQTRALVTGDSYRSQHPLTIHFGLGNHSVEKVEIVEPNGRRITLSRPAANQYHWIKSP